MAKDRATSHTETLRHREAFDLWYWEPVRSFKKVALSLKLTVQCIHGWAKRYNWAERARERDAHLGRLLEDKTNAEAVKVKVRILQIAQAVQARFTARLLKEPSARSAQGVSQYEPTAADAAKWTHIQLLLTGQATSRSEITFGRGLIDQLVAAITGALKRAIPSLCPHCHTALGLEKQLAHAMIEASDQLVASQEAGAKAVAAGADRDAEGAAPGAD